jgi:hypothetical protein
MKLAMPYLVLMMQIRLEIIVKKHLQQLELRDWEALEMVVKTRFDMLTGTL